MLTIGQRIEFVMKTNHLTKSGLAADLGITPSSVSTMISGKSNPSSQTIKQISDKYSVNYDWLATGAGEPYALNAADDKIAVRLSHAITHNDSNLDRFLRAAAQVDDSILASTIEFMLSIVREIERQTEPAPESEDTPE